MTSAADVSGGPVAAPSGMHIKRTLTVTAFVAFVATMLALTWTMHQRANAATVEPTWQQAVVTVDDEAVVAAAQAWGAPFVVRYVEQGADVRVKHVDLSGAGKAGGDLRGEAEPVVDGDRITGCTLRLDPVRATDAVAAHEFGHCLGLGHLYTAQSRSLMVNGGVEDREHGSATVTEFDRAALAALYEGSK